MKIEKKIINNDLTVHRQKTVFPFVIIVLVFSPFIYLFFFICFVLFFDKIDPGVVGFDPAIDFQKHETYLYISLNFGSTFVT